jgi:hypothetical protein
VAIGIGPSLAIVTESPLSISQKHEHPCFCSGTGSIHTIGHSTWAASFAASIGGLLHIVGHESLIYRQSMPELIEPLSGCTLADIMKIYGGTKARKNS